MVSDEALKKLQEQIAAWPMTQRFVVQQLIEDYSRDREDLRAYKATGLTPEEVLPKDKADEIALKLMRLADLESLCSYTRLRELTEADKDGRLVVLPCKVGDMLYEVTGRKTISVYKVKAIRVELFGLFIEWDIVEGFVWQSLTGINDGEIGKTVFLTREEAEAALKEMRADNDTNGDV